MDPHNVLTGVKAVCPGAAEWVRRLRAERRGLRWLAIQFSDIGSALVELLGEDAVVGELQPADAALRRALGRRREVDGGSEGEERSPETAAAGERAAEFHLNFRLLLPW